MNPIPSTSYPHQWPVECPCGKSYTKEAWGGLRLVAQFVPWGLSLRDCECGSTKAVPLHEDPEGAANG